MKRLLTAVLFTAALASAQTYTYTFVAPAGSNGCDHGNSPQWYTEFYNYLIENSTPPYPNGITVNTINGPRTFFASPLPNTPLPVSSCSVMSGFASSGGVTANLQIGNSIGWLRTSANQQVELNNIHWTNPPTYPDLGQPATFSMDADIVAVCASICQTATGNLHMTGPWSFKWITFTTNGCKSCGVWHYIKKFFSNSDQLVIDGQSTVAILD